MGTICAWGVQIEDSEYSPKLNRYIVNYNFGDGD